MIERRSSPGFLNEAPDAVARLVEHVGRQDFKLNFTIELCIVGEINLTYAARAYLVADFVASYLFVRGERQRLSIRGKVLGSNEGAIVRLCPKTHKPPNKARRGTAVLRNEALCSGL